MSLRLGALEVRRLWPMVLCAALLGLSIGPTLAQASPDPFIYTPVPPPPSPPPPFVPPAGQFEGPCGLAVDSAGNFYVADHYHDVIDRFSPSFEYSAQIANENPADGACGLAIDTTGLLYVNHLHGSVSRFASFPSGARTTLDPGPATGVAVDPATADVYVNRRTYVAVYDSTGAPVEVSGQPLKIGEGSLEEAYGIAVSGFPATEGFIYVPDAGTETVKVFDPASDTENPVKEIDPGFTSLRDAAIAVDDVTGEIYVADDLQPGKADEPEAAVDVFKADGSLEGRLKYNIFDARPAGLAVDNSGTSTQSRVYVTSGNTEKASVMAYQPGSAGAEAKPAPEGFPVLAPGQGAEAPLPEPPPAVTCEGDSCQQLPSEPRDPTLTTLLEGSGNPPVNFHDTNRLSHYHRLRDHHHGGHSKKKGKRSHKRQSRRATATSSGVVRKGNLQVKVSGGLSPKRLPREGSAPVAVSVAGEISTTDQSPPPELEDLTIELNRHGGIETKGLPECKADQINPASTQRALQACRSALVGQGSFSVEAILSGQEPYPTTGKLLLFNGTYKGKHALLGQIYSAHPFATSFVIPFSIQSQKKGRYGLTLSAKLPAALISWGRVTGLSMRLHRLYSYQGKSHSFASAGCPAPKGFGGALFAFARASFHFAGGKRISETLTGHCGVRE
jgi:DNA-binding beta-propeller fold protein YncE